MKTIDCLLIGYYKTDTSEIHSQLSLSNTDSCSYRDFNLGFVYYNEKQYSLKELHNKVVAENSINEKEISELNTFNAGISYLSTYLNKSDISFDYITLVNQEIERLEKILTEYEVRTIAILTTLYVTPDPIVKIIDIIKKKNNTAKIIVGGPFVSNICRTQDDAYIEYLISHVIKADYFINSSQGETGLKKLISAIKNNGTIEDIENLMYLENNKLVKNIVKEENNNLSENMVDWSLFNSNFKEFVNIRTAISCPFACSFCGFPEHAGKYQTVNVELIEKELIQLVKSNKSLKSVYFIDDTFNVPKERFKDILKMLIKNKFGFKWHSYFRCQFADEEVISLMKESGCEGVFLGIESGNNEILKNMNKKSTIEDYSRGIKLLKEAGILTFGAFITGFPGETFKSVFETIKFIESSGLDFYRTQLWFSEHITPIYKRKEEFKIEGEGFEWSHKTMNSKVASSYIEKMCTDIKNVTWLPQYDFDYETIFRLLHNGMKIEQVKSFVEIANENIKDKIRNKSMVELPDAKFEEISKLIQSSYKDN